MNLGLSNTWLTWNLGLSNTWLTWNLGLNMWLTWNLGLTNTWLTWNLGLNNMSPTPGLPGTWDSPYIFAGLTPFLFLFGTSSHPYS